jgi:hypothetical protein
VTNSHATAHEVARDRERKHSLWPAIIMAAFIASLLALLLLLGMSMVNHRFFRGGQIDNHGVLRP